jgi:nucleotide-binding universal stress UspA family protein
MAEASTPAFDGPLVVGYDGRDESEVALDLALEEAGVRQVDVLVLVVAPLPVDAVNPLDPNEIGYSTLPEMTEDGPVTVKPIVEAARRKLAASAVRGTVEWTFGSPASEILRVADERDACAIVVGTHHHSALGRLLGADVAASVVRHAHRDVVVAR